MLREFSINKSFILVLFGLIFFSDVNASQEPIEIKKNGDTQQWGFTYPGLIPQQYNRVKQRMDCISWVDEQKARVNRSTGMSAIQKRQQIQVLDSLQEKMISALNNDNEYGRAIAIGLAGDDWKALEGENIQSIGEGVKLGGLMRVSRACSDVLGKRIENSIDYVLGGAWDTLLHSMANGWNLVCEGLFHSGEEPFSLRQIKGWQELVKVTVEDLERLLKDGLRDSLRGYDMTLRTPEQGDEDIEICLNAWNVLINGYVRQFDYIVSCIDRRMIYYEGNEIVLFYAQELKLRLLEFNHLLSQSSSIKELDGFLDSNKAIIPALKKNILNLFARLVEVIEPITFSAAQSPRRSSGSGMATRSSLHKDRDDEDTPNSFRPSW